MNNLILFLNSFVEYLIVFCIFVVLAGVAVFIGITLRKRKNAKEAAEAVDLVEEVENTTNE